MATELDNFEYEEPEVEVDTFCVFNDIDDYDLYAEKMEEDETDGFGDDLILE